MCPTCRGRYSGRNTYHIPGVQVGDQENLVQNIEPIQEEQYQLEAELNDHPEHVVNQEEMLAVNDVEVPAENVDEMPVANEYDVPAANNNEIRAANDEEIPAVNDDEMLAENENDILATNDEEMPAANEYEMPFADDGAAQNVEEQMAIDFQFAIDLQLEFNLADAPEMREQPKRAKRATVKLCYELFTCCVCKKHFHTNDFPSLEDGTHVCSTKCFRQK